MRGLEPHITVRAVQPVVAGLEELGHDADSFLDRAPIRRDELTNADGRVPHRAMMALWEAAVEETGDASLGIHVAEAAPVASFGVHAYALLSSPSLREAYRRGCRYQRLIHEATTLEFEEGASDGILHHSLPGGRPVPRHPAEFLVTVWVRLGRLVAGTDWTPSLVSFAHSEPGDISEHARVFGAPIRFASVRTALHVPNAVLDTPNPRADEGLADLLDDHATLLLARVPHSPTVAGRVGALLAAAFAGCDVPTAEHVARDLALSVRSLHRGLREEGTTFRELLDRLRHERSAELLADPRLSIAEIGYLLGFAEISSFYRAFKRWSGQTPAEFRAHASRRGSSGRT
jgi:AraC-like DNA-binding protein